MAFAFGNFYPYLNLFYFGWLLPLSQSLLFLGGLRLNSSVHVQFQGGYVLKFYIFTSFLVWGFLPAYSILARYVHKHGGDLGEFDSRGSFIGSFQLMRKSLMTYDPLGIILLGDIVDDLDFLGRILFLITYGGVILMLWECREVLEDSDPLGKNLNGN